LVVMGAADITDAQREWLLLRRKYCLAQIKSLLGPQNMNTTEFREVAKAADATLRQMLFTYFFAG
ncbi:PerC family transcriptional regulator, partial [Escherichia coli]